MKHLLPPDILQPAAQILDALDDVVNLALVGALDGAGLADGQVEGQLDAAGGVHGGEPVGAARGGRGHEADLVVARVGGREGEAARGGALLGDDAVVVVEDFLG